MTTIFILYEVTVLYTENATRIHYLLYKTSYMYIYNFK